MPTTPTDSPGLPGFLKTWGALMIAVIALVQPWAIAAWRRFVRRGAIDIYETGTIEVGYSGFGATIGLHGTLRAQDRDFFIRNIDLEIVRESDQSRHRLDWGLFRSHRAVLGRPEEMTLELPAGFLLMTSQPHRYNIQFFDTTLQAEIRGILEPVNGSWLDTVQPEIAAGQLDPEDRSAWRNTYDAFSAQQTHVSAYTAVDRLSYWTPGKYNLALTVRAARPDRVFKRAWSFTLSESEVRTLRLNVVKMLQDTCGQFYGQYNFSYVAYGQLAHNSRGSS